MEAGGEIIIAKHGAPPVKLVPVKKEAGAKPRAAGIERIQRLSRGLSLGELRIKDLINEGRPVSAGFVV